MARTRKEDILKDIIAELKLSDIRKDIIAVKEIIESKLNLIRDEVVETKEHVKVTNGAVAKAIEQNVKLKSMYEIHANEDNKNWEELNKIRKETSVIRWLFKHPRYIYVIIFVVLYTLAVPELRDLVLELLKKLI